MAKAFAVVGLLIAVAGCSGNDPFISWSGSYHNWPLEPVSYGGTTDVASHADAQISVQTVSGERPTTDQLILPSAISSSSWNARHPNLSGTFNEPDQIVFGESFRTELERVGLFSHVASTKIASTNDVRIKLHFTKSVYLREAYRYILHADMQLERDGGSVRSWQYVADSNEGWSFAQWTFQMHQGEKAKARVAATLMKKMIADVEGWLKDGGSIRSDTQPSAGLKAIGAEWKDRFALYK